MKHENTPFTVAEMSGDEYHRAPGLSSSQLKSMAISPAHFWNGYINPDRPAKEDTPAFQFGKLVHCMVLEPHTYAQEYITAPKVDKRTKQGKADWLDFEQSALAFGQTIVSQDDVELAGRLSNAVNDHHAARELLGTCQDRERSGWWHDPRTGELLKYRADARSDRCVVDLKTTNGPVDYDSVQRAIWNFNYHTSAAHYLDGDAACFGTDHNTFVLIFVSKQWPHEVGVYYLDHDAIELGRRQNRTWLHQIVDCKNRDTWPAVNDGQITEIGLPAYALKKLKG